MAELYPRLRELALRAPLRHRPQHRRRGSRPPRALARPARAPALRAGARRLERHRLRRPGLPEALPVVIDWLIDLARSSRRRLMVRLVKGAYWDTEIKRAQVDGLDGYPVYTRKVYTDVRLPRLREGAARARRTRSIRSSRPTTRTRSRRSTSSPGRTTRASTSSSACTAWASRSTSRSSGRSPKASSIARAASTRRSARTRRCSPTSCAACSRTAPTPRSSTASSIRRIPLDELVADPVETVEALARAEGALGLPHPAIPLPRARSMAPRARTRRGLDLASERAWRDRIAAAFTARAATRGRGAAARRRCREAAARTGSQSRRSRRRRRPLPRSDSRRRAGRARLRRRSRVGVAATPPHTRAAVLEAGADALEADTLRLLTLLVREAGKTYANAVAEVREAVDFLRYYAPQARRDFDNATHAAARPGRLHQPVEFPARDLHRPGRRRAGRRQPGARQAGRADAADRRRRGATAARGRRAARRAAAAARPRRDGRRRAGRRSARRGRHLHRLDRGRAPAAASARRAPGRRRPARCR